ncbi:MAG: response regulator [Bacteroidales bacterium]|nr:response regulator [Bacteroidales bacterium]
MKKHIVLVDDFENTLKVIEHVLSSIDCDIYKASNGTDALKFFDGREIDLLVTDYNMPGLDGAQLTAEVRKLGRYRSIPILMLTTETSQSKKDLAKQAQITGWIQKPFKSSDFQKIIKRALNIRD